MFSLAVVRLAGGIELIHLLKESVGIVRGVVLHDLRWVERVDLLNVVVQLGTNLRVNFLDLLQTTRLDKLPARIEVIGQYLRELLDDVLEDVRGGLQQGFQCGQSCALLDDALESSLRFSLEILAGVLVKVDGQESPKYIGLSQGPSMVWGVTTNLTERPSRGGLQVVFRLVDQGILERRNALGNHDRQGQGLREGRDVAEGHDAGEAVVAAGLSDVVHHSSDTTGIHNELRQIRGVPGNLADACRSILSYELIDVLEAMKNPGEDFGLDDDFGEVDGVLCDLGEAAADLALQLGIIVGDVLGQERDGASVNHDLSELRRVLADVAQRRSGDALERELGFLEA
mmetsp:Transcript_20429/g.43578  ORF Transcript_20429/g.43578 Transcript_20429/m.43578 type:complete len:343 (+) Transcript_20429:3-1031(+)